MEDTLTYTMTLDQIGSKGTIYGETNFGFAFTANYVEPLRRGVARHRVINVLSFCCQASYEVAVRDGEHSRACKVCGKVEAGLDKGDFSREFPNFDESNLTYLERIISRSNIDSLEAVIVAVGIADVLDSFWDEIAQGARTRQTLEKKRFSGEIEL